MSTRRLAVLRDLALLGAGLAAFLLLSGTRSLGAETSPWPSQSIRLVVPFVPGGSTDVLARQIAEKLRVSLGQSVVVENRGGAGGTVGSDSVAKAPPDGHTLLLGVTGTHGTAPSVYSNLPYHPARDFAAVSRVVTAPLVIVVHPGTGIATVRDFIDAAKRTPGALTYGSPGTGTSMHLTGVKFELAAGVRLTHVPYRGSAPALSDLLAGRTNALFGDLLVTLPHIRAGTITPIAVTSATRNPLLPDVPTLQEAGLPGFETLSWQGIFAPAGTPRPIVDRLYTEVKTALENPELKGYFAEQGFQVEASTPDEFQAFVEAEIERWASVVKAGQVRAE